MPATGILLPDHPVKLGDTWQDEQPFPIGDTKGKITCTLLSTESIQGQDTLKIKQLWVVPIVMSIGMDGKPTKDEASAFMIMNGQVTIESTANLLPANARVIKSCGDFGMKFAMQLKGPLADQNPFGSSMEMIGKGKTDLLLLSAGKVEPPPIKPGAHQTVKPNPKRPDGKGK